jgi:hypothetical protein
MEGLTEVYKTRKPASAVDDCEDAILAAAHDPDARDVLCWREYRASFVCFYFF